MELKAAISRLLTQARADVAPRITPDACTGCLQIGALPRTGHHQLIQRDDLDDRPSPVFDRLKVVAHFGEGSDYEIRVCLECGQFYYYGFKGQTYQISYSTNNYDEIHPAEEWCMPGTPDEVVTRVLDNYDIRNTRFTRIVRKDDHWLATTSSQRVGSDDIVV